MKIHLIPLLSLASLPAFAGERTSASYSFTSDTADAGGGPAASANYTHQGASPELAGPSSATTPGAIARQGYLAQLYEIVGLALHPAAPEVNEGETLQLGASQSLDDGTRFTLPPSSVTWAVASGPLAAVDAAGLATAELVYQDSLAQVSGTFGSFTAALDLTVLDSLPDNFGEYAGDGLADAWQYQYFGPGSPDAGPTLDPDGDGQNNEFEFTAGLIPTDSASRFLLGIQAAPALAGSMELAFSPVFPDRSYLVEFSENLAAGSWLPLEGATFIDDGETRTLTDPDASGLSRFYRVIVSKP